jgi:hypothetical protein
MVAPPTSDYLLHCAKEYLMKRIGSILALGCLIFLLTACSLSGAPAQTSASPTVPPTPTATPTPSVPAGTLLYQSDWSKGLAGWGGSAGWTIVQEAAQSDTSNNNALTVPYQMTVHNYALEYRFQIVSVPQNGGSFFLKGVRTQGKDGYDAGILNLLKPGGNAEFANPQIQVYLDPMDDMGGRMQLADYEPGTTWHTFRVEVQGPQVKFFTDDLSKGNAYSTKTDWLSNGPLELVSSGAVVRVSSVKITAL